MGPARPPEPRRADPPEPSEPAGRGMTELILWRHGQTDHNLVGRVQGQVDIPLNATGLAQAAAAARILASPRPDRIVSSPLSRARTTAQAEGTGDWLEANYELHSALYALANRPRTQEICLSLLGASQPYSAINIGRLGGRGRAEAEHEGMIAAIEGRDAPGLAALMVAHLSHARTALTASGS